MDPDFKCINCQNSFSNYTKYYRHFNDEHYRYKCPYCNERFNGIGKLALHEKKHTEGFNMQIKYDEQGNVIDGHNRAAAASQARLKPPTAKQLERVYELKNHPAFATGANLDWLVEAIDKRDMLKNIGTIGVLIAQMKKKVEEWQWEPDDLDESNGT